MSANDCVYCRLGQPHEVCIGISVTLPPPKLTRAEWEAKVREHNKHTHVAAYITPSDDKEVAARFRATARWLTEAAALLEQKPEE